MYITTQLNLRRLNPSLISALSWLSLAVFPVVMFDISDSRLEYNERRVPNLGKLIDPSLWLIIILNQTFCLDEYTKYNVPYFSNYLFSINYILLFTHI